MDLSKLRKAKKITQSELSKELYISQPLLSFWEKGLREPSIEILPKLAELLHISIEELVYAIIETKQTNLHKSEVQSWKGFITYSSHLMEISIISINV